MKNVYLEKNKCCGCTACMAICPKDAIEMKSDEKGFLYPQINQNNCIDCGLCRKTCDFTQLQKNESDNIYGVGRHKNNDIYRNSQSGGAFTAISDLILKKGGIVYAANLCDDFVTRHIRVDSSWERDLCRKSKYVQSLLVTENNHSIFESVLKDLKERHIVLFCGTGCQSAALWRYMKSKKIDLKNLFLLDLICNGVGTPLAIKEYIEWLENKYKAKVIDFNYRDTLKFPYGTCVEKITFDNKKNIYQDYYANLYYHHIIRPSCYNCKYTTCDRVTDFTIGDAWGIEKSHPEMLGENGCSVIMFHTEKSKSFIPELEKSMDFCLVEKKDILQPRINNPGEKPEDYDEFWNDFINQDFDYIIRKWGVNQYSKSRIFKSHIIKMFKLPFKVFRYAYLKIGGKKDDSKGR